MPPAPAPFRAVAGAGFGVRARNAAAEPHDGAVLEAAGLTALATLNTSAATD